MKRIFLDSDIFVRDLRYLKDSRFEANRKFLEKVFKGKIRGATSIFNVLEVCGVLSFNFTSQELKDLYTGFVSHYNVRVLFPADPMGNLQYDPVVIFNQIQKKQSLGDAEVSYVVQRFSDHLSSFVSWNARHFEGKISMPVKTPEDF